MYYFSDGPTYISSKYISDDIGSLVSSKTFYYTAILSPTHVFIYEQKNNTLIGFYGRSTESIEIYGYNKSLEWSMDSRYFAISTSEKSVLLFSMNHEDSSYQTDETENSLNLFTVQTVLPSGCNIQYLDVIAFQSPIKCLSLYRGDLIVCTTDGYLNRIKWDGRIIYNQQMLFRDLSFYNDLEFSKDSKSCKCESICKTIEWFPSWNGIVALFENGKGAFLHIPNHILNPKYVIGVWAENLQQATCVAVNVKFRSVAFGCQNGKGIIYKFDEETGALRIQHVLSVSRSRYPDSVNRTGPVRGMKWNPDNFCLVIYWESGEFSLWSAQGFLIFCSLGSQFGAYLNFVDMNWGCEGYSLWGISRKNDSKIDANDSSRSELIIFPLIKSCLITNNTLYNQRHMILLGSTSFSMGLRNKLINSFDSLVSVKYPEVYLSNNWPIKFVSINADASLMTFAGRYGFCLYFTRQQKWRYFGNELVESSMEVVGGMVWYKIYLCLACYDNKKEDFEIRIYDSMKNIDDSNCFKYPIKEQVLLLNGYYDTIMTLTINGHVTLYNIIIDQVKGIDKISLTVNQIISLENYIDFAACVVSLHLSSIHSDIGSDDINEHTFDYKSLIVNYSGHLLMFQKDKYHIGKYKNTLSNSSAAKDISNKYKNSYFSGPLVIAYDVENVWIPYFEPYNNGTEGFKLNVKTYAMENSLWINCGSLGLKVWLSLKTSSIKNEYRIRNSFLSKRIMLLCKIPDFYPLVVLNGNILLLAVCNEFNTIAQTSIVLPSIEIKHNIFIHHLIKQLLKINLGVHALDLTNDLKDLSYFNHALELLLHEVLEEEATSKEPIPDPLLPRVIAFTQEFPDFLKIVVQCARKTELALWSYLFESAGDPKDLFESCLENNKPEVAASYLVILQNTEPPFMSQQHAVILMTSALYQMKWCLVKDLLRFLKNIAQNDCNLQLSNTKMDANTPFVRLHKKRFRSGGYGNVISTFQGISNNNTSTYTSVRSALKASNLVSSGSNMNTNQSNVLASRGSVGCVTGNTLNNKQQQMLNQTMDSKKLKQEMFVDTTNSQIGGLGIPSPTVKSTPVKSIQDDLYKLNNNNSNGSTDPVFSTEKMPAPMHPNSNNQNKVSPSDLVSPTTSFHDSVHSPSNSIVTDFMGLDARISTSSLVRDIDQIITRFAHDLFREYRLYDLFEMVANVKFTEQQFKGWLSREREHCSRIIDPLKALTRLHQDFNWSTTPNQLESEECAKKSEKLSVYEPISSNSTHSKKYRKYQQKIKYALHIFWDSKYWEWCITLLVMLHSASQIYTLFDHTNIDFDVHRLVDFLKKITLQIDNDPSQSFVKYQVDFSQMLIKFESFLNAAKLQSKTSGKDDGHDNKPHSLEERNHFFNGETSMTTQDLMATTYNYPSTDVGLLSPPVNHQDLLELGQLEINLDQRENTSSSLHNQQSHTYFDTLNMHTDLNSSQKHVSWDKMMHPIPNGNIPSKTPRKPSNLQAMSNHSLKSSLSSITKSPPHDLVASFKLTSLTDDHIKPEKSITALPATEVAFEFDRPSNDENAFQDLISNELDDYDNNSSYTRCTIS